MVTGLSMQHVEKTVVSLRDSLVKIARLVCHDSIYLVIWTTLMKTFDNCVLTITAVMTTAKTRKPRLFSKPPKTKPTFFV